jgi:RNA polymerase sigma-70 factor (ECF subfamily)
MIDAEQRAARLTTWLTEHRGIMHKIARAYAAAAADQADLLQDMTVQLWRSLSSFREQALPSTWIYRVCLNTALTWRRRERLRQGIFASAMDAREPASDAPRPGWSHEQSELLDRLYAAVRELPAAERSLVVLALDGMSYRAISEITGLTENHIGVALTRTRQKLAEQLKGVRHEL